MPMSETAVRAVNASETDEAFVALLTITHPQLPDTIRVCAESVHEYEEGGEKGVLSNGEFFARYPFSVTLPSSREDEPARTSITIGNVDRAIVDSIRQIQGKPQIRIDIVLLSSPDVFERTLYMALESVSYDDLTIDGQIVQEDFLNMAFPAHKATPNNCPGLF